MSDLEKEIDAYLNGEMTPEMRKVFEDKILNDTEAKKEFELHREMNAVLNENDWEITETTSQHSKIIQYEAFLKSKKGKAIANSIQNAENDYFNNKSQSRKKQILLYGVSIAALFVIGLFIFFNSNNSINSQNLYAKYSNWEELPSLTSRNGDTDLAKAEKLFRQKQYQNALLILEKHQSTNDNTINPQVLIYIGVIQLELNNPEAANKNFQKLLQSNSLDAYKAHWYLALCYLKSEKIKKAKKELEIMIKDTISFKDENAQELIKQLK
ncbi:tetratricopeptide repeat protein [Aquimarina algiphila]|uniref:tetratricopeptide repeat protein n=1 Tax=Aquimarina algiphila TaxID=2047982 RepID=UPI00232DE40D|nr:tetratricopeptide repeat protein [Aquimarina algiphila]